MKIHKNYIAAVNFLRQNPDIVREAWSQPSGCPGGILFGFCSRDRRAIKEDVGCLTMVRHGNDAAATVGLTERIRADVRIPCYTDSEALIINLMVFAEWQQIMDDELGREPPRLHAELIPFLPGELLCHGQQQ